MNRDEEHRDLAAARAGDERAFARIAFRHRQGLELYCRLMLGCPLRAHDAVGETLVRGWSELHGDAPQSSVRIWLYRLATGVCLEAIEPGDEFRGPHPFDGVRDRNEPPR